MRKMRARYEIEKSQQTCRMHRTNAEMQEFFSHDRSLDEKRVNSNGITEITRCHSRAVERVRTSIDTAGSPKP